MTEKIDIVISETGDGSRIVQRSLDAIAATATRAISPLKSLRDTVANLGSSSKGTAPATDELRRRMQGLVGPAAQVTAQLEAQVRQLRAVRNAAQTAEYQNLLKQQQALKREITGLNGPQKSLTDQIWEARAAVTAWAASLTLLWQGLKMADQYQVLENRLRSTGLAGEDLLRVQRQLYESANNTRSSVQGTVELYSRLSRSSSELGVTEAQLIQFTTSLNQAILLSGATSQEAHAGLIQLSQGMASGSLRGDELRSVLEQLPEVADVIAKKMGVTQGELRKLGSDGKISAKIILEAFAQAKDELASRFASLAPTMGQAFTVLRNKLLELVGPSNQGALGQVSGGIMDLGNSLEDLRFVFAGIGFVVQSTVQLARVAFQTLRGLFGGTIPLLVASMARGITETLGWLAGRAEAFVNKFGAQINTPWMNSLKSMTKGMREWADSASEYLGDVQTDSLDMLAKTGENMADIYRIQEEADKKSKKKTPPKPPGPDLDALSRLQSELMSLVGTYDRVWAAEQKVYDSTKTLDAAQKAGLLTEEQSIRLQNLMYTALKDELDPRAALNRQLQDQESNLSLTAKQIDLNNRVTQESQNLQRQGITLTDRELGQLRSKMEFLQAAEESKLRRAQIVETVKGPAVSMSEMISDLQLLQDTQQLTRQQALDYAREQIDRAKLTYDQINELRKADLLSEQEASQKRIDIWLRENEARYSAASATFGNLAVLSQSTNSRLAAIGKASAVTQATIDGVLAVQKALASAPPPWNYALAASVGVATAANVAKISGLPGFAFGGDFKVGGTGGTDSQVVAFRATPGERVQVSTPSQNKSEGTSETQSGTRAIRIVNVVDPKMVGDFLSSSEGDVVFVNSLRRNSRIIQQLVPK